MYTRAVTATQWHGQLLEWGNRNKTYYIFFGEYFWHANHLSCVFYADLIQSICGDANIEIS